MAWIEYREGDALLEGYFAAPTGARRPGVLVIHEISGLDDFARGVADRLAGAGYAAFAADMFGKGTGGVDMPTGRKLAEPLRADPERMRARARAGLDALAGRPEVDPARLAAIGFCFGGGVALELARSGAPLAATVSFHGLLSTSRPALAGAIRGKVLVLAGGEDPVVKPDQALGLWKELSEAGVDWEIQVYGGAGHGFTNPAKVGPELKARGVQYDPAAERRGFRAMFALFEEVFT